MSCRKPDPAARVEVAKRARLTAEHQQRPRARPRRDARADVRQVALDRRCHVVRRAPSVPVRSPSARMVDVTSASPPCCVREDRNRRARKLLLQIVLRAVDDDQVGPQAQDALEVGIEQRARHAAAGRPPEARGRSCSRRPRAARRRWQTASRSPPAPARRSATAAPAADGAAVTADHAGQPEIVRRAFVPSRLRDCDSPAIGVHHALRISNHRKNGPPMSAVTMPTGSSMGAITVRETRSQATRNAAPKPSEAGTTSR